MALKMHELPQHTDMVKNILYVYSTASPDDMSEGISWYQNAYDYCVQVANGYGLDINQVVELVSVISPGLIWGGNCTIPEQIIDLYQRGVPREEWAGFQVWPTNLDKAYRILSGEQGVMNGDKVINFHKNIWGFTDNVTVDRWSIRVAFDDPTLQGDSIAPSGKKVYNAIADAYKEVATIVGQSPSTVQAVTWTVYRYKYNGRARKERERMQELVNA